MAVMLLWNKKWCCFSAFLLWFAISQIFPHTPIETSKGVAKV